MAHIDEGLRHFWRNDFSSAVDQLNQAIRIHPSPHAIWNRGLALLALGRYREGFRDFGARWALFPDLLTNNGKQLADSLPKWSGEPIAGRRLVVVHEMGFGDTVMALRFLPRLAQAGAIVSVLMPPELHRLAVDLAPASAGVADFWCPIYDLPLILGSDEIPAPPYLVPSPELRHRWQDRLANELRPKIGIAWSARSNYPNDFDRSIPLVNFLRYLKRNNAALFSLQLHDRENAAALGVMSFSFNDFAELAAFTSLMDLVISVDTAALHVAGAIGHPNVHAILPYAASWRWLSGNRWYPEIDCCFQSEPGDWDSAFDRMRST